MMEIKSEEVSFVDLDYTGQVKEEIEDEFCVSDMFHSPEEISSMDKRGKRSANFTIKEEKILLSIVTKYKHIIDCKKTDHWSLKKKMIAWETVTDEFNSLSTEIFRDAKSLKNKYGNCKKQIKKLGDYRKSVQAKGEVLMELLKLNKEKTHVDYKVSEKCINFDESSQIGATEEKLEDLNDVTMKRVDRINDIQEIECTSNTVEEIKLPEVNKVKLLPPPIERISRLRKIKKYRTVSQQKLISNVSKWSYKKACLVRDEKKYLEEEHRLKMQLLEEKHDMSMLYMKELHDLEKQKKSLEIEILRQQLKNSHR